MKQLLFIILIGLVSCKQSNKADTINSLIHQHDSLGKRVDDYIKLGHEYAHKAQSATNNGDYELSNRFVDSGIVCRDSAQTILNRKKEITKKVNELTQ